ncbi:MAG: glycerophosphoryl diester phosphodiesterase, partial [Patescibacteria group bacterium]
MIKKLLYLTITLLAFSCQKKDFDIVNLNNNQIDILGHAGMGISSRYPINSFESVSKSLAIGADGTELDVQLTADGILVVFHDQNLESSTNKKGIINDLTWAQIEGAYYNLVPYHDYKVIKLESIFEHTKNLKDYRFALDCKLFSSRPKEAFFQQYASALIQLLDKYQLPAKTIIESPDPQLLKEIKSQSNNYTLFWYTNSITAI